MSLRVLGIVVVSLAACGEGFSASGEGAGAGGNGATSSSRVSTSASSTTGTGGAPECGPGSTGELSDAFEGTTLARIWELWSRGGASAAQNDALIVFIPTGNTERFAGVSSTDRYSLRNCAVSVEVPAAPTAAGSVAFLQIGIDDQTYLEIALAIDVSARIIFGYTKNGAEAVPSEIPYDSSQHRFWRISERDGEVSWHTSQDGMSWDLQRTESMAPFPLDDLVVTLGAGAQGATALESHANFDNVNL